MPALIGVESFGHSFSYDANAKTRIVAMRNPICSARWRWILENFSSYHNAGAYEDEQGNIHALVCKLEGDRPDLEKNFSDMYNSVWTSKQYNHLYDMCLSVKREESSIANENWWRWSETDRNSRSCQRRGRKVSRKRKQCLSTYSLYVSAKSGGKLF